MQSLSDYSENTIILELQEEIARKIFDEYLRTGALIAMYQPLKIKTKKENAHSALI